ncbi:hypothetical protein FXV77_13375 [Sphingobacterium phlebotomi]|uniref:Methane monooxygenase PmoA-like n=1 Tax=Sphingobacterium phlebotomi TaxID=2605433 RepID=A0A5D4H5S4_9SPHI|nr:PmoA family protein [Sphingobacterium phlebotomi]TYR35379.1 hypothetical protein FXV77_13375 [Sphingobacterium phlebotomi]
MRQRLTTNSMRIWIYLTSILMMLLFGGSMRSGYAQDDKGTDSLHLVVDSVLTIFKDDQPLLTYHFNTVYPPRGQDSSYQRSGFIHPVYTLKGQPLTRIQPKDHYHHYGIWNPWTHTLFERDTVDFWNLYKKEGTVRFVRLLDHKVKAREAVYTALHDHVVFKENGSEEVALHEWQTVKVHLPEGQPDYYWIDITIKMRCATSSPLRLLTYRYGGLGWRAVASWGRDNSNVLTSEGKTREDTDGTRARWCMAQGELPQNGYGGMAILSHPGNFNHPEPLRIWDGHANAGKENVFINFSPTKDRDWLLEPGHTYTLNYRLVVFDGQQHAAQIENKWQDFASEKR